MYKINEYVQLAINKVVFFYLRYFLQALFFAWWFLGGYL